MQGTNQHIGSNLGFSVLPKDTLTCRQEEEPGFEPATHGSWDNLLYLLSHSHPQDQHRKEFPDTSKKTIVAGMTAKEEKEHEDGCVVLNGTFSFKFADVIK